jgi:hypothetical protein
MRYLCLVYFEPKSLESLSKDEIDALVRDSLAYDDTLRQGGHFVAAHALQPVQDAATVRVRKGEVLTTDGPFAETKEVLGGFILIEARDRDEALRLAARIPMAQRGSIEVRPIRVLREA